MTVYAANIEKIKTYNNVHIVNPVMPKKGVEASESQKKVGVKIAIKELHMELQCQVASSSPNRTQVFRILKSPFATYK